MAREDEAVTVSRYINHLGDRYMICFANIGFKVVGSKV